MFYPRSLLNEILKYYEAPEAIIITGMRRTGKTTLLNHIYDLTKTKNKIFLDFENPLNRKYFEEENYEVIKSAFELLGIDFNLKPYIFLDEIQFVKNLPSVVKYFIDKYGVKFFLTGSASFYLKKLFTESLSGRKFLFELFPLSFKEFLGFKESPIQTPSNAADITRPIFDTIIPLYDEYLLFGGFPGVVMKSNIEEKKKSLDDIFSSYYQLEILQLGDFRRNSVVRDLMLLLMQRVGSKLDIQKISRELSVSRPTLYEYISFLEATYFIKTIRPFSRGKNIEIRKMPKVYLCDTGLANHFSRLDAGHIFENAVFLNLCQKGRVNYYQRKSGAEIDFLLDQKKGYEVKLNPQEKDARKLKELSESLGLEESIVVSKNYCEVKNSTYGFIL